MLITIAFFSLQMAEVPEVCAAETPKRSSPRIGRFVAIDCSPNYFIFIEQQVYLKVSSFAMALLIWFSSHYVFNLEYHKYYKDAAMFIQEFIFDLYESDTRKKKNRITSLQSLSCNNVLVLQFHLVLRSYAWPWQCLIQDCTSYILSPIYMLYVVTSVNFVLFCGLSSNNFYNHYKQL